MFRQSLFWEWLIALIAALLGAVRHLVSVAGGQGPDDPDDWTPVPPLTAKAVEYYAFQGCTDREIADRFLVDEDRLRRDFAPVLRATRGLRAMNLRRAETKLALDNNGPMLIWVGRNDLGQSNNPGTTPPPLPEVDN